MIRFPILALLGTGCAAATYPISDTPDLLTFLRSAPSSQCVTLCGVRAAEGDCQALKAYEDKVVKRLALAVPAWRAEQICAQLSGFMLEIHRHHPARDAECVEQGWLEVDPDHPKGRCLSGLTSPRRRTITVSTTDWEHSAFAHEVAHVADNIRDGHCPWTPALKLALLELGHRVDPATPDPSCFR